MSEYRHVERPFSLSSPLGWMAIDQLAAGLIASLNLTSAYQVTRHAWKEIQLTALGSGGSGLPLS